MLEYQKQMHKLIIQRFIANIIAMLESLIVTIPLGIISAVITIQIIKKYQRNTENIFDRKKRNAIVLLVAYIVIMIQMAILFRPWGTIHAIDLIPFDQPGGVRYIVLYGIANIIVFLPAGVLLPMIWKRMNNLKWVMAAGFFGSLFIEASQLILQCGMFQIEDLIMNTVGAGAGYLIISAKRSQS